MTDIPFKLNTGATIPALGLGTWQSPKGQVRAAVAHAIKVGYRHIDCAYVYGNEKEVGEGIKEGLAATGISRRELFITIKLWNTYHTRVPEALDKSLELLGLDYVDLYLVHWPIAMNPHGNHETLPTLPNGKRDLAPERSHIDTYKDVEKLLATRKVKAIGVCNYSAKYLKELLLKVDIVPAVNQIEKHPLLPQQEISDLCNKNGIHVTAYSPFGSAGGPLLQEPHVANLAEQKGVTPSTILLSYHIALGNSVLAKSSTLSRIEENKEVIRLTQSDLVSLEDLPNNGVKRYVYLDFGVDLGFPDKS